MSEVRLILVAAPELIPALRERVGEDDHVLTFADSEPLRALEAITAHRPAVVALERLFAASPRGAALISRVKADPSLDGSEIRVLSHDTDYQRVLPRGRPKPRAAAVAHAPKAKSPALDRGTRRAPRFRIRAGTESAVDDRPASLVDLSVIGTQVVAASALARGQKVTVRLGPPSGGLSPAGVVVWAKLELARTGPAYRVGVEFVEPDRRAIGAFVDAHKVA
jgi:hypothetical protein